MPQSSEPAPTLVVRVARRIPYARRVAHRFFDWRDRQRRTVKNITRKNTLRAYDRVYGSDSLLAEYRAPVRIAFYEEVAERCAARRPQRVVDVGCGTGDLLGLLVERTTPPPELVVGIDHSRAGIDRARAALPDARWLVADLYSLPPDLGRFDLVLCTEVLEHVHDAQAAVDVLCRLCAQDGVVAITVPDGALDSWEGHVNFWDEDQLRAFLEPFGQVEIERVDGGASFLAWLAPTVR